MNPVFFHIDVNSAFLSWTSVENLKNGSGEDLRLIPSIIGGDMAKRHGVVLAKSIPAKKYHIQTGEPIVNALRKCRGLTIAPPNHALYEAYSNRLFTYLYDICPEIEQLSIDECFLDFTPISHNYTSATEAAAAIKTSIQNAFGFTVNIGISDRKVLAKMASDFQKPNQVHTLFQSEIREKMWSLPVSDLYMCGKSSVTSLRSLGILTIGDLAQADQNILCSHLKSHGILLWEYANGIDPSKITPIPAETKGIGNSITLSADAVTTEDARLPLLHLAESVSARLREKKFLAGTISVEIKYSTFQSVSHQTNAEPPTDSTDLLFQTACRLFDEAWNQTPIRLLGIRTSKLTHADAPVQMSLFDISHDTSISVRQKKLDTAIDSIRLKYGSNAVTRGSLLHKENDYKKH